jgi:hypothetical protein
MEWQPIETAPTGKLLILFYPETVTGWQKSVQPEMIRVDHHPVGHPRKPTHWLPLPKPPKQVKE